MLNPKVLLKHFGIFWICFILLQLLISLPGVRNGLSNQYASWFASTTQKFLTEVNVKATAKPETGEILFNFYNQLEADRIAAEIRKTGQSGYAQVTNYDYTNSPKHHINTALVFLIALFLATPVKWGKRFLLAAIGVVVFYLFTLFRMVINVKDEISQSTIGLYQNSPDALIPFHKFSNLLGALGFIFVFIILVWAFLVFNKRNMAEMKSMLA